MSETRLMPNEAIRAAYAEKAEKEGKGFEPVKVVLNSSTADEAFMYAPMYEKFAIVSAVVASENRTVTTVLDDGTVETTNIAEIGDYIVTNPGGEEYVLKPEKFWSRYEKTEEDGIYKAKGRVVAILNETGVSVSVTAPWGEEQIGGPDCMLVAVLDEQGMITDDRYLIGGKEFQSTYQFVPTFIVDRSSGEVEGI